jgi:phage gp36-like protein
MTVGRAIWRMTEAGPVSLEFQRLGMEERLEDMIFADPSLVGLDLLVVGRQVPTLWGGYIDLLGVDSDGHLHVLELKRDRTPREVVAQILDYASWAQDLTLEEVSETFAERNEAVFADAFGERFSIPLPDVFNPDQRLTIVASELDPASERIIEYLASRYAVPVNAVFFRHFDDTGLSILLAAGSYLRKRPRPSGRKRRPARCARGTVAIGMSSSGASTATTAGTCVASTVWCQRGVVPSSGSRSRTCNRGTASSPTSEGQGTSSSARSPNQIRPFREATINSGELLIDQSDIPDWQREVALKDNPDVTEYAVGVKWEATANVGEAVRDREKGLFASQVPACRMKDERTIKVVTTAFGVTD